MAIIQNAVRITEGSKVTFLTSSHVHDYKTYVFQNGLEYSVDGGKAYIRRGWSPELANSKKIVEWNLDEKSTTRQINARLLWGCRGKDGKQPLFYQPIKLCDTDHLEAILRTQGQIKGTIFEKVIRHEIKLRALKLYKKHFKKL